ncbi:MAG TPA: hypothetical protein DCX06_10730 [Opitutae bacterium]|nr:hypothetical protein [Opitutae bacterium]
MSTSFTRHSSQRPTSDELLDFLLEHIPDVIFFKDQYGQFLRVNHAFLELFGLGHQDEVIGKSDANFLDPEDAERTSKNEAQVMASGQSMVASVSCKHREDGTQWWSLTSKLPLKNQHGRIIGTCGISKDITALKEAEQQLEITNAQLEKSLEVLTKTQAQLIKAEKAQSIARLAEGLAHEVRNPLSVISMGCDFLSNHKALEADSDTQNLLKDMQQSLARADRVIETLLQAARPKGLHLEAVEANEVVRYAHQQFKAALFEKKIFVNWELSEAPVLVMADSEQLSGVLSNLFSNAIEAMPHGGTLTMRTQVEPWMASMAPREVGSRCGQVFHLLNEVVSIQIVDTGLGIAENILPRIFDAFFTTKETGPAQGLGLGLTTSQAIIELHDGLLELRNCEEHQGAVASVKLRPALKQSPTL